MRALARAATGSLVALCVALALVVSGVAAFGIASTRSAMSLGNTIAGDELKTATVTGQLSRQIDAAFTAGQEALEATQQAERDRMSAPLYTSLLPAVDALLFQLEQLHAGDPPAEHAEFGTFIRQWDTVRDLLSPAALDAQPATAAAARLTAAYQPLSAHLNRLFSKELDDGQADHAQASVSAARATWLLAGAAAGGIALGIGVLYLGIRRIRRNLWPSQDQAEFADTLQIANDEDEAHRLLQSHLERALPQASAVVLNRNNSADRLEAVTPLPDGSPLAATLRGAEPRSCLAVRSGRIHAENAGRRALLTCSVCAPVPGASSCVPLTVGGEVIGSVLLSRATPYSEAEEQRIRDSVSQAAPVLANLRNLAVAEIRAATDGLTGLPNKRAVNDALKRTFAQATATKAPLALLLADLDHFKAINDQRGHAVGDQVLASVGATLRASLRAGDFAGRNGGEEFAVLLPDTEIGSALEIAERIRAAIAEISLPGSDVTVTASIGVGSFPDHASTLDRLERLADAALYVAKRQGRNRVELADVTTVPDHPAPLASGTSANGSVPVPVPRERLPQAPHRPQVGEGRLGQRGPQVGGPGRAARAAPRADRPLHHLDVVVAPLLHALVQVDQQLAHRAGVGVVVVDLLQHLLHPGRGLQRLGHVALAHVRGHVVALPGQVAQEGVEQGRPGHRGLDAGPLRAARRVVRHHHPVPAAQDGLELAELSGLETARGAQRVPEPGELGRRHGLQHVQLGHHDLQDGQRPAQRAHGVRGLARLELGRQPAQLVQQLLEPQLVYLVDDDEQHLVVLGRPRLLGREQLVQPQVPGVGNRRLSHLRALRSRRTSHLSHGRTLRSR
jgi:diguanylate cyclase (GGDEF)-like protein